MEAADSNPDFIREDELRQAVAALLKRGKERTCTGWAGIPGRGDLRADADVGPYEKEHETIAVMKMFAEQKQLGFSGKHHEIYLSDPRRVPPERLKTILRMPIRPV